MRRIIIEDGKLIDGDDRTPVACWHNNLVCATNCAAFAKVGAQTPQGVETMAVCAAVPQQIPIGTFGAPSGLVVPSVRPVMVKG